MSSVAIASGSDEPKVRRWTRPEYHRLVDQGLLNGGRSELLRGQILIKSPLRPTHSISVPLCQQRLTELFGKEFTVRVQQGFLVGRDTELQPDLAIVRGSARDFREHPRLAELIVEVSDTTLTYDRGAKLLCYARSAVPEYWIVDLVHRVLLVHEDPIRRGYKRIATLAPPELVSPRAAPKRKIRVAELLP